MQTTRKMNLKASTLTSNFLKSTRKRGAVQKWTQDWTCTWHPTTSNTPKSINCCAAIYKTELCWASRGNHEIERNGVRSINVAPTAAGRIDPSCQAQHIHLWPRMWAPPLLSTYASWMNNFQRHYKNTKLTSSKRTHNKKNKTGHTDSSQKKTNFKKNTYHKITKKRKRPLS